MARKILIAAALSLCLTACGGGSVKTASSHPQRGKTASKSAYQKGRVQPRPAPRVAIAPRVPVHQPPPPAKRQVIPGLEGMIGASREDLLRQFGPARLDVYEGDARKLQFSGEACVLDVFLYPAAPGREPEATYVEARRASDAQDVDDLACINALRRKP